MRSETDGTPEGGSQKSPVIDVDRHVQETWDIFQRYAEPQFREHVYQKATLPDGSSGIVIAGRPMIGWSTAMWDDPGANKFFEDDRFRPNNPDVKEFDVKSYLADMDKEDVDAAVVIPTLALGNGTIPYGQVGAALCRAYVRWVSEYCAPAGGRLLPVAPVNLYDVGQAVADGVWAVEKMQMRGFLVAALPVGGRNLDHPDFFPFWAMAQDMGVPVQIHSISSLPDAQGRGPLVDVMAGVGRFGGNVFFHHLISHRLEQHLASLSLIAGGVLERFPGLRLVFSESGGGWFAGWLEDMDSHYHSSMRRWVPWLKASPSEYFRRQCIIGFDAEEATLGATAPLIGIENVAWFSDYPHYDCVFPGAVESVRRNMSNLPPADQRKILGENVARFYKIS
jgi:predicted TIM-barrel fold metal-dependent hydrolase